MLPGHVLKLDGVGRDGTDFNESIVLNEDVVAVQIAVNDGRITAAEVAECGQDLRTASLPRLIAFRLPEKLLHGSL